MLCIIPTLLVLSFFFNSRILQTGILQTEHNQFVGNQKQKKDKTISIFFCRNVFAETSCSLLKCVWKWVCTQCLVFLVGAFSLKEKSPTLTVSSFFFQLTISLWVVHFSYNFCSSFIFVHLSSSTQPESVGSNRALNHKFFNEFFGIVRPKKYFFFEKKSNFFLKKKLFSKFFQ